MVHSAQKFGRRGGVKNGPKLVSYFLALPHVSLPLQSQEDIDALLEEVAILQAIHHPHVMHLLAFYDDSKYFSLVTEIVDGGELFDRIVEKQHYNEHIAREFVKIFLVTLDFLHSNGIVHRGEFPRLRSTVH